MALVRRETGWVFDVSGVHKTFRGKVRALQDVALRVHAGEIFGLLGPNGAGKSTLVKILMTIVRASAAKGTMLGAPVGHKSALARVGYLPEHLRFPDYLTGGQALDHYGALAGLPRAERRKRAGDLLALVSMAPWAGKKVSGYSKGMKQRLGVAQSLMHDPDLVLLDEPTDGVDPGGRRDIRQITSDLRRAGKTVFINSHILSELEMVCDRVAIMVKGRVVSQGTVEDLTRKSRRYEIAIEAPDGETAAQATRRALPGAFAPEGAAGLLFSGAEEIDLAGGAMEATGGAPGSGEIRRGSLPGGEWVEVERSLIRVGTERAETVQPIIDALRARGVVIRSVTPVRMSLEDLFIETVGQGEDATPGAESGKRVGRRRRGARGTGERA